LNEFLGDALSIEPTDEEIEFAAFLETAAQQQQLAFDTGESLLVAVCVMRGGILVTGDKRAIAALEELLPRTPELEPLHGRVGCLEQAIGTIANHQGELPTRAAICAVPVADRALWLSMECSRPPAYYSSDGLHSYVDSVRRAAPTLLVEGYDICTLVAE
jgi:hypothetical protein